MPKPQSFRVYYSNGTTWDDDLVHVPRNHVLGIQEVNKENGRRLVVQGYAYVYRFERGLWLKAEDFMGVVQYLDTPGTQYKILFGEMVFSDEWNEAMKWMKSDPDLPPRTGWHPSEPKE